MKAATFTLLASIVVAASTTAISSSSSAEYRGRAASLPSSDERSRGDSNASANKERFAPRFDGLRFIETLVTAHR